LCLLLPSSWAFKTSSIGVSTATVGTLGIVVLGVVIVGLATLRRNTFAFAEFRAWRQMRRAELRVRSSTSLSLQYSPLRLALVLLVACAWAFLMGQRIISCVALWWHLLPTALMLCVWGVVVQQFSFP